MHIWNFGEVAPWTMLTVMVGKCINGAELVKRLLTTLYSIEIDSKLFMNGE
jgi:hypothetical protein